VVRIFQQPTSGLPRSYPQRLLARLDLEQRCLFLSLERRGTDMVCRTTRTCDSFHLLTRIFYRCELKTANYKLKTVFKAGVASWRVEVISAFF
jgi:hypothetical protein